MIPKSEDLCVCAAGAVQHFRFEAARDLSLVSTMRHALGGEASFDEQSPTVLARRAAEKKCESARVQPPTLLLHYENDGVVPWAQSATYDTALVLPASL